MKTVKIEISQLKGYSARIYAASKRQVEYIQILMLQRGMEEEFQKYFKNGEKVLYNRITKQSASMLIDALKRGNEIIFVIYAPTPFEIPSPKIKTLYKPILPIEDVPRITLEEQRALEQKYLEEL